MKLDELYSRHEAVRSSLVKARRKGVTGDLLKAIETRDRQIIEAITQANLRRKKGYR